MEGYGRVLVVIVCLLVAGARGRRLNLTAECAESHVYYCSLSELSGSYDDPLYVENSSAPQLSELIVRHSLVTRFPRELFARAPNLRALLMHQCGLNRIQGEDFAEAKQLQRLMLQRNRLSELPEKVFSAAFALQELHLGNNHIHLVHGRAFAGLQQLRFLDLHENSVRELSARLFDDLVALEHIDLSSNGVEKIDSATFASNRKLQTVLLGDNKFVVFEPNSLAHLSHLRLLDLSYSALDELELESVDTLLVQSSGLRRCVVRGAAIKVRANNNQLRGLSLGDKAAVRELELHGNLLESLEDFVGMTNLQKLDVSKNQIGSLRTSHSPLYVPLPSLTNLNLAFNQLQNLSADHLLLLPKLVHLDLAFNHLSSLDVGSVFEPLLDLEKLYVEGNHLHRIDYVLLAQLHAHLKELGVFGNDWEFPYMRTMVAYLKERGVLLPVRFSSAEALNAGASTEHHATRSGHHHFASTEPMTYEVHGAEADAEGLTDHKSGAGVASLHPYWTTRDVLTLVTLLFVVVILLLQLYRILVDEECFAWCWERCVGPETGGETGTRPRRLEEDDSVV